jgi:putative restriction endonuclease
VIEIRRDALDETDGPTLQHARQGTHGSKLRVPTRRSTRPDTRLLEERYERFRVAG